MEELTPSQVKELERRYAEEHEAEARDGRPQSVTTPAIVEIWDALDSTAQGMLNNHLHMALSHYQTEVQDRLQEYLDEAEGQPPSVQQRAWESFLMDTKGERVSLRSRIISGVIKTFQWAASQPPPSTTHTE